MFSHILDVWNKNLCEWGLSGPSFQNLPTFHNVSVRIIHSFWFFYSFFGQHLERKQRTTLDLGKVIELFIFEIES